MAHKRRESETEPSLGVIAWRLALTGVAAVGVVLEHGFHELPVAVGRLHLIQLVAMAVYVLEVFGRNWLRRAPLPGGGVTGAERVLFLMAGFGAAMLWVDPLGYGWHLFEIAVVGLCFGELWRINVALSRVMKRPGMLLPLSFITMIAVGTALLKLPVAVPEGNSISWLDALFTMTSAVCVTGLTVRTTAVDFTPFGQLVIGIFIQLGGLAIIIFGSMLALLLGRALSLRENVTLSQMIEAQPLRNTAAFVRFIVTTTLTIVLIGAIVMMPMWGEVADDWSWPRQIGVSLFHSVSAFCNAGFDLTGESLEGYRYASIAHGVHFPLIVIGAIGFPVLDNLRWAALGRIRRWFGRPVPVNELAQHRLNLHTKVVLATTLFMFLFGVLFIGVAQLMPYVHYVLGTDGGGELPDAPLGPQLGRAFTDATFITLAGRTAGFNTMPMEEMTAASNFTTMILMIIGGSPGSVGGGVKTTAVALLVLSVVATMRKRQETEAFGRTISDALVRRAATIGICYLLLVGIVTLLLSYSEPFSLEEILFEAISGTGTVGLSLGITEHLTPFGKSVIIAAMFLGRIGPLTLLAALVFTHRSRRPYAYAHENVALG